MEDYDAQIAALQAKKEAQAARLAAEELRQAKERAKVLVQASPAKKRPAAVINIPKTAQAVTVVKPTQSLLSKQSVIPLALPKPSAFASSLSVVRSSSSGLHAGATVDRSSSFQQQAVKAEVKAEAEDGEAADWSNSVRDDDSLTIKEKLQLGPKEFGLDTEGLDEWRAVEPNSGIRLSKRQLSHSLLQAHLDARYHLSPSLLYSVIRLSRDSKSYDVPVEGDWVTIAVVAERSEVRTTSGDPSFGNKQENDTDDVLMSDEEVKPSVDAYGNAKRGAKPTRKKKFISMTLCSLPPRTKSSQGFSGGDALLKLLLFEAETSTKASDGSRQYKGGSGGAFEKWSTLTVGSVIAILNPRVLRPLKGGSANPHPLTLPLALNPTSADAVSLIGQSRDLGICKAMRKDGNRCTSWVDSRQTSVCDYHLQTAVKEGRNGRAEFSSNTGTFTTATRGGAVGGRAHPGRPAPSGGDASKKWGLLPKNNVHVAPRFGPDGGGGVTYVVGGSVVSADKTKRFEQQMIGEQFGRGKLGRDKRKREEQEAEAELQRLLEQEGSGASMGAKYLRAAAKSAREKDKALDKGKGKAASDEDDVHDSRKRPFSVEAVRRIGFNPSVRGSSANIGESAEEAQKRINAIMELQHRKPKLGRIPGTKVRSGVVAPKATVSAPTLRRPPAAFLQTLHQSSDMIDLESSGDEN